MKKILIVDDEQDVCVYLSRLLEENGYAVECAADGEEALRKVAASRPDLVTLDLSMPGTSGVRFYREVKSRPETTGIPVVLVTGVAGPGGNPEDTKRFYSTRHNVPPPDGFIAKPIDPAEIVEVVGKLIGGAAG